MSKPNRRTFLHTTAGGMVAVALSPILDPIMAMPFSTAIRVAVIGIGRQGRAILSELQKIEQVTIVAICDIDEIRLRGGQRRVRDVATFTDHRELLAKHDDVQAVFIATPTHTHRAVAIDVLEAGKHVYCEAPLASMIEDCRAIVRAARKATTLFQTGLQGRSNPIYKLAWTFVRSGSIRDVVSMRGQNFRKTSWRTRASDPAREKRLNWRLDPDFSIGLMGELGTQQFDVFHYFRKQYPVSVRGHGSIRLYKDGRQVPDTCSCELRFADDTVLQYQVTLANSYEDTHELFFGTMGTVKLTWTHGWLFKEADAPTQGWEVYANRQRFHNEEGITLIADATQLASQGKLKEGVGLPNNSLFYAIEDFLRSIDEGKPPACSAEEGLRATAVGILANRAVMSGNEIKIDDAVFTV